LVTGVTKVVLKTRKGYSCKHYKGIQGADVLFLPFLKPASQPGRIIPSEKSPAPIEYEAMWVPELTCSL
jgi:hypothetical protein